MNQNMKTEREKKVWKVYKSWLKLEEAFWRPKSRLDWLKFGDANTNFFHWMATLRKKKSSITILRVNDQVIHSQQAMSEALSNISIVYFWNLAYTIKG